MFETVELQRQALDTPVEPRFVHKNPNVKGLYTTGDYVRWKMNQVFGPDHWSHEVITGPDIISLNDQNAYVQVKIRLTAIFANGMQVVHDDVGVSVLQASRGGGLDNTAPERYETVLKSAITDGIKACTEYLGICFRPLADDTLDVEIRRDRERLAQQARNAADSNRPVKIPIAEAASTAIAIPPASAREESSLTAASEAPQAGNGSSPEVVQATAPPASKPAEKPTAKTTHRSGTQRAGNGNHPTAEAPVPARATRSAHPSNGKHQPAVDTDRNPEAPATAASVTPTHFWSRFNELKRNGQISARIINAEEIAKAKRTGEWAKALEWLDTQIQTVEKE